MVASLAQKGGGRAGRTAGLPTLENNPIKPTETEKNRENLDAGLPATHREHTHSLHNPPQDINVVASVSSAG